MNPSLFIHGDAVVGRVSVDVRVTNNRDLQQAEGGFLPREQVRSFQLEGIVDTGATHLVLPEDVVRRLGLPVVGNVVNTYADRRTAQRELVDQVYVELAGRTGTYRALVEPSRTTALIGALVLEDMDLVVDCRNRQVVPRDPNAITAEVE